MTRLTTPTATSSAALFVSRPAHRKNHVVILLTFTLPVATPELSDLDEEHNRPRRDGLLPRTCARSGGLVCICDQPCAFLFAFHFPSVHYLAVRGAPLHTGAHTNLSTILVWYSWSTRTIGAGEEDALRRPLTPCGSCVEHLAWQAEACSPSSRGSLCSAQRHWLRCPQHNLPLLSRGFPRLRIGIAIRGVFSSTQHTFMLGRIKEKNSWITFSAKKHLTNKRISYSSACQPCFTCSAG